MAVKHDSDITRPMSESEPLTLRFLPCGDSAVVAEFARVIDDRANARVLALDAALAHAKPPWMRESVPTYRSLLVHYDCEAIAFDSACETLRALDVGEAASDARATRHWRIPVAYGGAHGIDLDEVAAAIGVSAQDVVARHAAGVYRVAMLGFTPGFAYLSGLDPLLHRPRRLQPRLETPAGTISIGGAQASVQCLAAPSGWHLLGRTPVRSFQLGRDPVFLIEPGDAISFAPIDAAEFARLDAAAAGGEIVAERVA